MAIRLIEGDIFTSDAHIIVHQVNCRGKMGSGVALQVKQLYPEVYAQYLEVCSEKLLGHIQLVDVSKHGKPRAICNMFSQLDYGYDGKQYTIYSAFKDCLIRLREMLVSSNGCSKDLVIALPYKIGCDRGGADWYRICEYIESILGDLNVEIWKYNK